MPDFEADFSTSIAGQTGEPQTGQTGSEGASQKEAEQIVAAILRSAQRLRVLLSSHLSEFGLNDIRFTALEIIDRSSESGGCSQAQLAEHLGQSESSVSTLVDRMRSSRLLYRLQSQTDKRRKVLMLSEQGRDMLTRARQSHAAHLDDLLKCFDDAQRALLYELLHVLVNELSSLQSHLGTAAPARVDHPSTIPSTTDVTLRVGPDRSPPEQQAPAA